MRNTEEIITQCRALPGVTVLEREDGAELQLSTREGTGSMRFFPLFPGLTLAAISVSAPCWPAPVPEDSAPEAKGPLIINYCTRGRCELVLNDNRHVFLTAGHVSLTEKFARSEYVYPGRDYEGVELFVDPELAPRDEHLLQEGFGIDLASLRKRYCPDGKTCIAKGALPDELLERLFGAPGEAPALQRIGRKTAVIDWLSRLQYGCSEKEPERLTYYTRVQVEMAKRIEAILLEDLSRQHTAQEFAALFSVSESSVKNYFRGVFGQSIAQCLMSRRMRRAAQQLTETALPIIDIAGQAGYENQSKFSAAFRRHFGVSPREYRSGKKLTSSGADKSDRAESGA